MKIQNLVISILVCFPLVLLGQLLESDFNPNELSSEIRSLVKKMAETDMIHSDAIGYSGEKSDQYKLFEKLLTDAKIKELLELMNHPKTAVRGYAFWGLAKKHFHQLDEIFVQHANDHELVFIMQGCSGDEIPMIQFMRWVVTPEMLDLTCKKLDTKTMKIMTDKQTISEGTKNK